MKMTSEKVPPTFIFSLLTLRWLRKARLSQGKPTHYVRGSCDLVSIGWFSAVTTASMIVIHIICVKPKTRMMLMLVKLSEAADDVKVA